MGVLDRILLFITGLLAAYQVVVGVEGLGTLVLASYTIAFGVLLVACLLLIILGFEVLNSPVVVVVSTIIPLSLSLGLVAEYLSQLALPYLIFVILGFLGVLFTRLASTGKIAVIVLTIVHGISGLVIFILPFMLSLSGVTQLGFMLVGVGGALIGIGGVLLSFLKAGKAILPRDTILSLFPVLLLLMTVAFVAGFALA
ncbi:MAG: hypothetical protein PVF74_08840 [Anaerolineales bacterium]|jgi:hypothetical protein